MLLRKKWLMLLILSSVLLIGACSSGDSIETDLLSANEGELQEENDGVFYHNPDRFETDIDGLNLKIEKLSRSGDRRARISSVSALVVVENTTNEDISYDPYATQIEVNEDVYDVPEAGVRQHVKEFNEIPILEYKSKINIEPNEKSEFMILFLVGEEDTDEAFDYEYITYIFKNEGEIIDEAEYEFTEEVEGLKEYREKRDVERTELLE